MIIEESGSLVDWFSIKIIEFMTLHKPLNLTEPWKIEKRIVHVLDC